MRARGSGLGSTPDRNRQKAIRSRAKPLSEAARPDDASEL